MKAPARQRLPGASQLAVFSEHSAAAVADPPAMGYKRRAALK